jgi:hypothetical protein
MALRAGHAGVTSHATICLILHTDAAQLADDSTGLVNYKY